ncbi:uncharacterized protein MYCGRDRAFT_94772 [Zymoseptoria tritici IPO323]|uniref:Uncharacterized protein n=1 Tax=Zymoseptoria tritici (strain CBS 115943 / IPO323) TaxID=336722 RepID=F9XF44_ZYMTI|nr:uncharacterized protein MYCGRDRAFT_94772 [Zymoseptoria tritici IPO323]EGP85955.1 hypothetical protein MYCGRDRAFT_94772 [Zymoseptoria tritici IPO323]
MVTSRWVVAYVQHAEYAAAHSSQRRSTYDRGTLSQICQDAQLNISSGKGFYTHNAVVHSDAMHKDGYVHPTIFNSRLQGHTPMLNAQRPNFCPSWTDWRMERWSCGSRKDGRRLRLDGFMTDGLKQSLSGTAGWRSDAGAGFVS